MTATSPSAAAAQGVPGYQILVPPGWERLDLRRDIARQLDRLAARTSGPRPPAELRRTLTGLAPTLTAVASEGAVLGVREIFFPLMPALPTPLPVTIAVAGFATPAGIDPMQVLVQIAASDPTALAVDVSGSVALRTERASTVRLQAPGSDGADGSVEARRHDVRYVVGDPDRPDRWLSFSMVATVPDGDGGQQLADALADLFDATMQTFRWLDGTQEPERP